MALFRDIPVADFETILPVQRPVTRAFDVLKLVIVFVSVVVYVMISYVRVRVRVRMRLCAARARACPRVFSVLSVLLGVHVCNRCRR